MSNEFEHGHGDDTTPHRHTNFADGSQQLGPQTPPADEQTVQLREEELHARTQPVESGQVRVGKDVVEEQQTLDVPVTHEEVTIERRPVDRRAADAAIGANDDTISVPVRAEQVSVEKRAVVTEEINVGKRHVQDTQQVSGTVRREEARIEQDGDVDVDPDR
jgi:uncharacterized protein (TIGR02271 family)